MPETLDTIGETTLLEQSAQPGHLSQVLMAGRETVGSLLQDTSDFLRHNALRIGATAIAAVGAVGALGVGTAESIPSAKNTPTARTATANRESKCVKYDPDTVSVSYVDKAVLPLASEVINVYRHTAPSERHRINNTNEMSDNSYQHVTEIDVSVPARFNGQQGLYDYAADFKGRIIPKDLIAVFVQDYANSAPDLYSFELTKSTRNGPSNNVGLHWEAVLDYGDRGEGYTLMQSKLANGGEVAASYSMTEPILKADNRQAISVLKRVERQEPITQPENLAASQKLVKVCP